MRLEKKEYVTIEMELKEFNSLVYFLQRGGTQTELGEIDSAKAYTMYNELIEMVKNA